MQKFKPSCPPVRRVYIRKGGEKQRPWGIATIKGRVVQMACVWIPEPIFEADFLEVCRRDRPGGNAHQALEVNKGKHAVRLWGGL